MTIPDDLKQTRDALPKFFRRMGLTTGAEIGVYRGAFTEKFCLEGLKTYAIDPWIGYSGSGRSEKKQEMQNLNYSIAQKTLSPYKNCTILKKTSMEALNDFKQESLDFVYIDGDHRFRFIAEDISEWYQKVRKGGIISGHDYLNSKTGATNVIWHVRTVVDAFIEVYGINDLIIFGRNDKTLSWMFVK